jgi:hypothetical protein
MSGQRNTHQPVRLTSWSYLGTGSCVVFNFAELIEAVAWGLGRFNSVVRNVQAELQAGEMCKRVPHLAFDIHYAFV